MVALIIDFAMFFLVLFFLLPGMVLSAPLLLQRYLPKKQVRRTGFD